MIREHYQAVRALIPPQWTVHEWNVPDGPSYPYALLWGGLGQESTEALGGTPDTLELTPKITYAAETGDQLIFIATSIRGALFRARPIVHGWRPERLGNRALIDVSTDFDVTIAGTSRHPVFAVDEFPLISQRA